MLDDYVPALDQTRQAEALLDLLVRSDDDGLGVSLIAGYGLDALYGKLTRDHHDFDFLVEAGSRDGFVKLLSSRGYVCLPEECEPSRRKEAYRHGHSGYQAEFVALDSTMLAHLARQHGFHGNMSMFFPDKPNGRLLGYPVRTPTLAGVEIIELVQGHTAAEKGWAPYKHIEHRALLLDRLKSVGAG
jgi:hypothetical protein